MLFSTSIFAVALTSVLSVTSAQSTYYPVDPNALDLGTKQVWCSNQISSCTLLCLDQKSGGGFTNDCDPDTLAFTCICSDGTSPNATQYSQTIPYFQCTYEVQNCVDNCGIGAPTCAEACRTNKICGATNPTRVTSTASSKTATKTAATPTGTNADDDNESVDGLGGSTTSAPEPTSSDDSSTSGSSPSPSSSNQHNAGSRMESLTLGALTIMALSMICGAFSLHM